jgi:hypothetical protein
MYERISFDKATWTKVARWAPKASSTGFQVGVCKTEGGAIFCGMVQSKTVKYVVGPKQIKEYAFENGEWVLTKTMKSKGELFEMFKPEPVKPTAYTYSKDQLNRTLERYRRLNAYHSAKRLDHGDDSDTD